MISSHRGAEVSWAASSATGLPRWVPAPTAVALTHDLPAHDSSCSESAQQQALKFKQLIMRLELRCMLCAPLSCTAGCLLCFGSCTPNHLLASTLMLARGVSCKPVQSVLQKLASHQRLLSCLLCCPALLCALSSCCPCICCHYSRPAAVFLLCHCCPAVIPHWIELLLYTAPALKHCYYRTSMRLKLMRPARPIQMCHTTRCACTGGGGVCIAECRGRDVLKGAHCRVQGAGGLTGGHCGVQAPYVGRALPCSCRPRMTHDQVCMLLSAGAVQRGE